MVLHFELQCIFMRLKLDHEKLPTSGHWCFCPCSVLVKVTGRKGFESYFQVVSLKVKAFKDKESKVQRSFGEALLVLELVRKPSLNAHSLFLDCVAFSFLFFSFQRS